MRWRVKSRLCIPQFEKIRFVSPGFAFPKIVGGSNVGNGERGPKVSGFEQESLKYIISTVRLQARYE
jgi:hypothetical protein